MPVDLEADSAYCKVRKTLRMQEPSFLESGERQRILMCLLQAQVCLSRRYFEAFGLGLLWRSPTLGWYLVLAS